MQCERCHREMANDDPIYRVANYREGSYVTEVCAKCCATQPFPDWPWLTKHQWRSPTPCEGCARPVITDLRRKAPKHVACSYECRQAVYVAVGKARRQASRPTRSCASCGAAFMPKRSDARYCSSPCRQKAFRRRGARDVAGR